MTGRRDFMKTLGAAALGHALRPRAPSPDPRAVPRKLSRIGLELFSVRDAMARDPERTLAAVRASGYTDVELLWSFGNFGRTTDRKSTRLNSSHVAISYAVFCLKKKKLPGLNRPRADRGGA